MRGTLTLVVVTLGLALAACGGSTASDGGTSGGTTGGTMGNDPTSACVAFCSKELSCLGAPTSSCGSSCANLAGQMQGFTCSDATGFFNCLAGLPCSDYTALLDGGGGNFSTDVVNCGNANGCH